MKEEINKINFNKNKKIIIINKNPSNPSNPSDMKRSNYNDDSMSRSGTNTNNTRSVRPRRRTPSPRPPSRSPSPQPPEFETPDQRQRREYQENILKLYSKVKRENYSELFPQERNRLFCSNYEYDPPSNFQDLYVDQLGEDTLMLREKNGLIYCFTLDEILSNENLHTQNPYTQRTWDTENIRKIEKFIKFNKNTSNTRNDNFNVDEFLNLSEFF